MMEIELNGAPHVLRPEACIADLVAGLDLAGRAMAIAVNREVVPRQAWQTRQLQPGDRVDIVRAIGGG